MTKTKQESPSLIDLHIGSRLRMRRRMLGMAQGALASTIGVSFQQLQKALPFDDDASAETEAWGAAKGLIGGEEDPTPTNTGTRRCSERRISQGGWR